MLNKASLLNIFYNSKKKYFIFLIFSLFLFSCGNHKSVDKITSLTGSDSLSAKTNSLTKQIGEHPSDLNLYIQRAKIFLEKKQSDSALPDIKKVLEIDSSNASAYIVLSDIYFAKGKFENCLNALQKSIILDKKNKIALLKLGELEFYLKNYDKAFEYIQQSLAIDNINPEAYLMLGMAYKEIGDTAKAIKNFQTVVEQDINNYHAYIQLGLLYASKKNKLAINYFNNALNVDSKSIEALYALGMFYQETGEYRKAIEKYLMILQIDPKYKNANFNIGYVYLVYLQEYENAKRYFTNAIETDSKYAEAYYNRGYCNELLNLANDAIKDYKKTLELKPNYEKAIEGLNRIDNKNHSK